MRFAVTAYQDEDTFLDDHIEAILSSDLPPLPPQEQRIGSVEVRWDPVGSDAFIQARGGTVDDRIFVRQLVASQLSAHGIKEAEYSFDDLSNLYHAAPTVDRERVRAHGLMPSAPGISPYWEEDMGLGMQPAGVYMSPNPVDTPSYERDIWRIDPSYVKDPQPDQVWKPAWHTPHPIPPEALTLYRPYEQSPWSEDDWGEAREKRFSREASFERTADWNDIMDKARRLIQQGRVRILRNGYNNIVAWVKGDHGEYNPEIFRQDPNSRSITGSDCECNWGEFQNQPRTRQWKQYQDRPCSHILAAYWQSLATPLDEDLYEQQQQNPQGQLFQGTPGGTGASPQQGIMQQTQAPQQPGAGPDPNQMQMPGMGYPSPADVLPQPEPDVVQVNPASVPGLRGPSPTNPINYPPGPGGTFSSWQKAGDESPFAVTLRTMRRDGYSERDIEAWWDYLAAHNEADRDHGELDDVPDEQVERWYENWESEGRPHTSAWARPYQHPSPYKTNRGPSRDVPEPEWRPGDLVLHQDDPEALGTVSERPEMYQDLNGDWHVYVNYDTTAPRKQIFKPRVDEEGNASGQYQPTKFGPASMWTPADKLQRAVPNSPAELPGNSNELADATPGTWTYPEGWNRMTSWHVADDAPLQNTQLVQLLNPDTATQVGRNDNPNPMQPGSRDPRTAPAGEPVDIPAGLVGEVLGTHPQTGMVNVLWMGKPWNQNSYFEPFGAQGWHFRSDLLHRPDLKQPGPAVRRTRR